MRKHYTITEGDIGKTYIRAFGQVWLLDGVMGHVLTLDVGKRIYEVDGILQVENDEQHAERLTSRS